MSRSGGGPRGGRGVLRGVVVAPGADGVDTVRRALEVALAGGPAFAPVPAGPDTAVALARLRTDDPAAPLEGDGVAVVVTTSGSTGRPRGVLLTAAALSAAADAAAVRGPAGACWLLALPVTSIGGLMVLVRAGLAGCEPVVWPGVAGVDRFAAASFSPAARALLARAAAEGRPAATSLVPTQLARLCDDAGEALHLLAAFDRVLIGGAPLPAPLRRRAEAAGVRLVSTYGATETCGGVVWDGVPLPGVRLRLGDGAPDNGVPNGVGPSAVGPGSRGALWVGGPTVAAGYRLDPVAGRAAFAAGWWRSGDVASRDADGRLLVQGRTDDVVSVGGVQVSLGAVERSLQAVAGITDVAVVAAPDAEWGTVPIAHVVVADDPSGSAATGDAPGAATAVEAVAVAAVRADLGAAAVPRRVVRHAALPLLPNGKVDRQALARQE